MRRVARYLAARSQIPVQPGKAIEFAERTQHHDGQVDTQPNGADSGSISANASSMTSHPPRSRNSVAARASVGRSVTWPSGLFGFHDHRMTDVLRQRVETGDGHHVMTGQTPGIGVFVVGRRDDRNRSIISQLRQPLDQRLGAGAAITPASARTAYASRAAAIKASSAARDGRRCQTSAGQSAGTGHGRGLIPVDKSSHMAGVPP